MTGLDRIISKIIEAAEEKAKQISEAADNECGRIYGEYNDRVSRESSNIAEECAEACADIIEYARSTASINRTLIIQKARVSAVDEAFERAEKDILMFPHEKYLDMLVSMLSKAMIEHTERLHIIDDGDDHGVYRVYLNKSDKDRYGGLLIDGLRRRVVGRVDGDLIDKVRIADEAADISGGLILNCGCVDYNFSLAALIEELRFEFEGQIANILFEKEQR